MPFAAIGRYPFLDTPGHEAPDIETMCGWDLEAEITVCKYYEAYHKQEAQAIGKARPADHTDAAYAWFKRRLRVQELLARGGRAAS